VETLVSTRLDPGIDPIVEADRRGAILAIVRMGNKDLEVPGGELMEGQVMPAGATLADGAACPPGAPGAAGTVVPYGNVPSHLSGVTSPQWGMPISGTPIGLPGPPHVPLGVPAGLQKHVMRNFTPHHMPQPVQHFKVNVRRRPGYSYPKPPTRMHIAEQNLHPPLRYGQPHSEVRQHIK
jgi:hypothetical protein